MPQRIPLDSELWLESESGQTTQRKLNSWSDQPPTTKEFRRLVEINSCSDSLYKSFYYALPYFIDELEKREFSDQVEMVTMLDWKLARAFEGESDEQCYSIFDEHSERLTMLLVKMILQCGARNEVLQDNLAAIAALNGDPVLAQEILRIEE